MPDPYEILGVTRSASPAEIRKAYVKLAKQNHPDLHPGDKAAEARFKEISAANDILSDEVKRKRFDAGEIDWSGAEQAPKPDRGSYRRHAEAQPGFKYDQAWGGSQSDDSELFADLFAGRMRSADQRGRDVSYTFSVHFLEAINGAKKRVTMADGRTLDITIPAGLNDGQSLRLRGQGLAGSGTGGPGDAMLEIHVEPHPDFRRDGDDIRSALPVTIGQALAGAKVPVETVTGTVQVTVPKGSTTGTLLRLRGKGVASGSKTGDHLVELKVMLPHQPDDDFVRSVVAWEATHPYDPRTGREVKS